MAWDLKAKPKRENNWVNKKEYVLSAEHETLKQKMLEILMRDLSSMAGNEQAKVLVNMAVNCFNYETIDEGFVYEGKPYKVFGISHKGLNDENGFAKTLGNPALQSVLHGLMARALEEANSVINPDSNNHFSYLEKWDMMDKDNKVINVFRVYLTPNARPLGVCRKEDRSAETSSKVVEQSSTENNWVWNTPQS